MKNFIIFIIGIILGYAWEYNAHRNYVQQENIIELNKGQKAFYYKNDALYVIKRIK